MTDQERCHQRLLDLHAVRKDSPELLRRLEAHTPRELSELLPLLFSTGSIGEEEHALRDTVQAVLYRKLTDSLVEAIVHLDKSTARMTRVGWVLTCVVGVFGILVTIFLAV